MERSFPEGHLRILAQKLGAVLVLVVANKNKMTSVEFLQGTALMEVGSIPLAAYYADVTY